jgi:glycerol dehydrogenase-like iron-containing ADH family enzyme
LREIGENRLKYPTLSVKETMLKLFALYLKTENPANTEYMKKKYAQKMKDFIKRCEIPEELYDLVIDKEKKTEQTKRPEFKQQYYFDLGKKYDEALT